MVVEKCVFILIETLNHIKNKSLLWKLETLQVCFYLNKSDNTSKILKSITVSFSLKLKKFVNI